MRFYTAISVNMARIKAKRQDWKVVWVEEESNCMCWILKYIVTWQTRICTFSIYLVMWNKVLLVALNFRRIFKSELSDTESKATEKPPERKNKLVNSPRAEYKFVHLMKLICKFVMNTQNAIRYCLLALSFDPTMFTEIAVFGKKWKLVHSLLWNAKI